MYPAFDLTGIKTRKRLSAMNGRLNNGCHCESSCEKETFSDWADFDKFALVISTNPVFSAAPVEAAYSNVGLPEKWYRCVRCGTIWRLVEPDPPFGGLWMRV